MPVILQKTGITKLLALSFLSAAFVFPQNSPDNYRLVVVDGEGALNSIGAKSSRYPVIQVSDANHKPVPGAYVEFDAPSTGAGATFDNGSTHFATTTNTDGLAVASKIRNNGISGSYVLAVHVSFRGQGIGEAQVHQTNISGSLSKHLQQDPTSSSLTEMTGNVSLSNSVLGIALGDQFLVNGASTQSNANLLSGTRIQSLTSSTTLYLHDRCEYVVTPHSAVTIGPKMVTLESGSVRAKRFGDCRIMYGGLWITGDPTTDGLASLNGTNLDVASISGTVHVVNGAGDVLSSVNAGTASSFSTADVSSGASIGGTSISFRKALLLGTSAAVVLSGLGLAVDAIAQPASSGTPTSP